VEDGRREMEKKVGGILISNFTLDKKKNYYTMNSNEIKYGKRVGRLTCKFRNLD
jgi:hypothetical protein